MYRYLTEYKLVGSAYGSYVIARGIRSAEKILALRGYGEIIASTGGKVGKRLSVQSLYRRRRYTDTLHALCYVGNALCHAGLWQYSELLHDKGLIHEMVHELSYTEEAKKIYRKSIAADRWRIDKLLIAFDIQAQKLGF